MKTLVEMRNRLNAVATEMSDLAQKDERSADDDAKLDQLLAEFNDLGPKVEREQSIVDAANEARKLGESRGRVSGIVPAAGADTREQATEKQDLRSVGQRFADSEPVTRWLESGGKRSDPFDAGSFFHRDAGGPVQHVEGMDPAEVRALINTGVLPDSYIRPEYVPGFFRGDDLTGSIRSALINGQTTSDAIVFFRETAFTNNAAEVGQATATTGSSGLKPESALAFEQATAAVKTIAHWIPITRQTLRDAPQLRTYVEQRLLDGLKLREDAQILNGDGLGENLLGLTEHTGVQVLDDVATTGYFATNPVADAGGRNENFNRVLRGKTMVRSVGRTQANFVVLNPVDLEAFLTTTEAGGKYFGAGPFSGASIPNLWGLSIIESEHQTEGEAVVGDGRAAAVWDRMQAQILIDTINDQFIRNMLTLLAEERLALTVFRPQAFAIVSLA